MTTNKVSDDKPSREELLAWRAAWWDGPFQEAKNRMCDALLAAPSAELPSIPDDTSILTEGALVDAYDHGHDQGPYAHGRHPRHSAGLRSVAIAVQQSIRREARSHETGEPYHVIIEAEPNIAPSPVAPVTMPEGLHPATKKLVSDFAGALADKLHAAEQKYGYSDGWLSNGWMDECRSKLLHHIGKGDPRDVAAYCAFLWFHGERTSAPSSEPLGTDALAVALKETPEGTDIREARLIALASRLQHELAEANENVRRITEAHKRLMADADARYDALLAERSATAPFTPTHVHANGGLYRFVAKAKYKPQFMLSGAAEWTDAVIYEGHDGKLWVTTPARWSERFAPLTDAMDSTTRDK